MGSECHLDTLLAATRTPWVIHGLGTPTKCLLELALCPKPVRQRDKRGGRAATLGSGVSRVDPRMPESTNAAGGGDEQIRISQIRYPVLFEGREGEGSGRATHPARSEVAMCNRCSTRLVRQAAVRSCILLFWG